MCAVRVTDCQDEEDAAFGFHVTFRRRPPPGVLHFDGYGTVHIMNVSRELVTLKKVLSVFGWLVGWLVCRLFGKVSGLMVGLFDGLRVGRLVRWLSR